MQPGVCYYVEHAHNRFYILSNAKSTDEFMVVENMFVN